MATVSREFLLGREEPEDAESEEPEAVDAGPELPDLHEADEPELEAPEREAPRRSVPTVSRDFLRGHVPEEPGFFSRAGEAIKSAAGTVADVVEGAVGGTASRLVFKPKGPPITPEPLESLTLPKPAPTPPTPKALGASHEGTGFAFPGQTKPEEPDEPIPVRIGKRKRTELPKGSPGMQRAAEVARQAPLAEQMRLTPEAQQRDKAWRQAEADLHEASKVITARPEGQGDEEPGAITGAVRKGLATVGLLDPAKVAERERQQQAARAVLELQAQTEGKPVSEIREPGPRAIGQAALGAADPILMGVGSTVLRAYGFQEDLPETGAESLASGAGALGGFMLTPVKTAHALLGNNVLKWLAPAAKDPFLAAYAKSIASQAATLSVASTLASGGDIAKAPTMVEAFKEAGKHASSGALLGSAFGAVGGAIPGNALLPRAARLGVGLAAIDVAMGTRINDDRDLAQKAFDYGLNVFFLWRGQDPRAAVRLLEAEAQARTEAKAQPVSPEQVLKSALDKGMERAARAPSSEVKTEAGRRADLVRTLRDAFAEEVGDVATQTTATELRTAREVAEQKTGGAAPTRRMTEPAGREAGPVLLDAIGRPLTRGERGNAQAVAAQPRPVLEVPAEPLPTAQERARGRAEAIRTAPTPEAPPVPLQAPPAPEAPTAPTAHPTTFKAFVEASGKRWPLTARDPDYVRLRGEFDEFKKGLYAPRPGQSGMWAVVNRLSGEEVDHLPTGARAQLEANRLNSVLTMDQWRTATVPAAPSRPAPVQLPKPAPPRPAPAPAPTRDLSAQPAPEPKIEPGSPAAVEQARQARTVEPGPPLPKEPPAPAPVETPPAPPPVAVGKEQEIRVPAGNRYASRYEIIEAEDLIPSHNARTFARDPRYPEGVQNRVYHSDRSEQVKVIKQAQDFEPGFLVAPSPDSSGTPIVAAGSNVVLSGNSRSMSLLRTLGSDAFERYKTALREMAPTVGVRPEDVDRARHPVLVRRLVGTDETPEFHRRFAKETNEGFTQALNTQAAAVSQGAAIKPETMEWIAGQVDALGESASLRDFLRSGKDRELVQRFINDGVFTERDLSRFIDPKTTQLNEDGKRLVERAILGNALPDPDLLAQVPDAVVGKIERSLGAIAKIKGRDGKWDLGKDFEEAVRTVIEVKATNAGSVAALRRQGSLLEQAGPTSRADTLADALLTMRPNDFKAALNRYADEAQRDVRGQGALEFATPMTPEAAFREAFGTGPTPAPAAPAPASATPPQLAPPEPVPAPPQVERIEDLPPLPPVEPPGPLSELRDTFSRAPEGGEPRVGEVVPIYREPSLARPFYSSLERAVADRMPERATPDQVRAITRSPGVKTDEVKWTGLEEWLGEQRGPVSKAEVLRFLRDNQVRVEEKVLTEQAATVEQGPPVPESRRTKFGTYTLPGGRDYRELLLTLPSREPARHGRIERLPSGKYLVEAPGLQRRVFNTEAEAIAEQESLARQFGGEVPGAYKSQHWPETPNILASVRFNDRIDRDGKRVLFIEEIQSDWHQEGRRKGYQEDIPESGLPEGYEATQLTRDDLSPSVRARWQHPEAWAVFAPSGRRGQVFPTREAAVEAMRGELATHGTEGIPPAPFSRSWHELAFKRMVRWAAERGYDRIAWTTGEQQADRYDLSKQADRIEYNPEAETLFAFKGKRRVIARNDVQPTDLPELIGKEPANRLLASPRQPGAAHLLEGERLRVGGHGMSGFYDTILPAFVAKYGKKWGARVGETAIELPGIAAPKYLVRHNHATGAIQVMDGGSGRVFPRKYKTVTEAQAEADRLNAELPAPPANTTSVHSIDVTPEMRRSVLEEGQALFQPSGRYELRPEASARDLEVGREALADLDAFTARPEVSAEAGALPLRQQVPQARGEAAGAGVRTLALAIPGDLKSKGYVELRGQTVRSAEDVAVLSQVFRDPRYETFRIIYVKGNEVVGHEGITSRMPGSTSTLFNPEGRPPAEVESREFFRMRDRMRRMGADGYFLLHNHPSGDPRPSITDVDASASLARRVPGFKGHVVIDSGTFGLIELRADPREPASVRVLDLPGAGGPDPLLTPSREHKVLGQSIGEPKDVAAIGRAIESPEGWVTVVYRAGGTDGAVRAVQEMPAGLLARPRQAADFLRGQQRAFGGTQVFVVSGLAPALEAAGRQLIRSGAILDHVTVSGERFRSLLTHEGPGAVGTSAESLRRERRGIRVAEEEPRYEATAPKLKPEVRRNLLEYGREVYGGGARDFKVWADKMAEDIGPGVRLHLPDAWSAMMVEMARTQGKQVAEPVRTERAAGQVARPRPPESARRAESIDAPLEPPPHIEDPRGLPAHQATVKAAEEMFIKAGVAREEGVLLSNQILDMLRDGRLRVPEMAEALRKHDLTFADFGAQLFRPGVRDAARRLGALGLLAQKIKAAGIPKDVLADIRGRDPEIDETILAMSWWQRANNVRRGLLVSQLATAMRNFEAQVGRVGIDVLDQGLQGQLQRRFGKTQTESATAAMEEFLTIFRQMRRSGHREMREKVDAILDAFPKETHRLFDSYMSDVNRAGRRDQTTHWVDRAFDKADLAVDFVNIPNRFQEYITRRAVFAGEIDKILRLKGKDLDTIVRENRVGEIDADTIKRATSKALEITFAERPAYGSWARDFTRTVNRSVATLPVPFPRFMMNSIRFQFEFSPLGPLAFLSKAERQRFANGDMRLISRSVIGWGMFLTAFAMREFYGGERWYEVRLPWMDRAIDARPFNPFASYLFAADIVKRIKDGTLYKLQGSDIIKGVLSVNVRAGLGSYFLDQIVEGIAGLSTPGDLGRLVAGTTGQIVSGLLMPLQTWTDFYAQIAGEEAQKIRDTREEPFLGEIKRRIPVWGETLPEVSLPTTREPLKRELPGVRQLTGLTFTRPKNLLEKELDRLQFSRNEILGSTGDHHADALIADAMGDLVDEYQWRLKDPSYTGAPNTEKRIRLRELLRLMRARAKGIARRENPDLFRELDRRPRSAMDRLAVEEAEQLGRPIPRGVRR